MPTIGGDDAMRRLRIPALFARTVLMKTSRGFAVYSGLPDSRTLRALRREALMLMREARHQETWHIDAGPGVGRGFTAHRMMQPRQRKLSVGGGPAQVAMYHDARLLRFLSAESGLRLVPSGHRGSYAYYGREGDFIGLHRDTTYCDLVMITNVLDNSDPADLCGALVLYPDRIHESIDSIQAAPARGATLVKLRPGETLIMFGGVIPHRVVPTRAGQLRVISALCFRAAAARGSAGTSRQTAGTRGERS